MVQEYEEQHEDDLQHRGASSNSTVSQPSAMAKPNRFQRFQDVEIEVDDDLVHLPEVDRYLKQKFNFENWMNAEGNIKLIGRVRFLFLIPKIFTFQEISKFCNSGVT